MQKTVKALLRRCAAAAALMAAGPALAQSWVGGADVSWVSQQEAAGQSFYSASGVKTDPFVLLKNLQINAIRLRVWVNPASGWCDGRDVLYKAKRAAAQGQAILIDFHYSDDFADPGKQAIPGAWTDHSVAALAKQVYAHTQGILNYLKSNGLTVRWVQVGNEINSGMLLPVGSSNNFATLATFINNGYDATKAVFPNAGVIVHLANGYDDATFRWFFDGLRGAGGKWDITGMSHYPTAANWATRNAQIGTTMNDVASRYGKPVMVVETGMPWDGATTAQSMVRDLIARNKAVPNGRGAGVFYWEPQASPGWQGYTLGALDNSGKFTVALEPF